MTEYKCKGLKLVDPIHEMSNVSSSWYFQVEGIRKGGLAKRLWLTEPQDFEPCVLPGHAYLALTWSRLQVSNHSAAV